MASRRRSRILAVQALYAWDLSGKQLGPEISSFGWYEKSHKEESEDELLFARLLLLGTIECITTVDELIRSQASHWDFDRINKVDLAILRLGAYSLQYIRDVPVSVTLDEAIAIAKDLSTQDSYKFVNGVLDGIRGRLGV